MNNIILSYLLSNDIKNSYNSMIGNIRIWTNCKNNYTGTAVYIDSYVKLYNSDAQRQFVNNKYDELLLLSPLSYWHFNVK